MQAPSAKVVSAISLIVGGIANIMLVSVVETTREIGIRKAVGTNNSAILNQFLVETIIISSLGGGIGLAGGIYYEKLLLRRNQHTYT